MGNGRLGAMVFGGVANERIQLNEDTLWSGGPRDWNNPGAKAWLPKVREAVFAGHFLEANELCKNMQGPYSQSYQPLGDLHLAFLLNGEAEYYRRELDLERGIATTRFRIGGVTYQREVFASFPDQVLVVSITADRPGCVSLVASLSTPHPSSNEACRRDRIRLRGRAPRHVDPNYFETPQPVVYDDHENGDGMRFAACLQAVSSGGEVSSASEGRLQVRGADRVVLLFSADTSFNGFDRSPARDGVDPTVEAELRLEHASVKPYAVLREAHLDDHRRLFNRVDLDLGPAPHDVPTDERIAGFAQHQDPSLVALVFQYGRYLLMASSRPGTQPANLQGIWNEHVRPPWSSNWTLNINSEMNYWPAETCNLAECHEPMLRFISELAVNGRETVQRQLESVISAN